MGRVKAWETLEDPERSGRMNMEQFHRLLLRAGFPEEEASEMARQRGWDRLAAGEMM